jgi:hypothetical protein
MLDYDLLTEWEQDFIISIEEQFITGNKGIDKMSEKQEEVVERIYDKRQ